MRPPILAMALIASLAAAVLGGCERPAEPVAPLFTDDRAVFALARVTGRATGAERTEWRRRLLRTLEVRRATDESDRQPRHVGVTVVADEECREDPEWEEEVRVAIEMASFVFSREFGIVFDVRWIGEWQSDDRAASLYELFGSFRKEVADDDSLWIGLSGQFKPVDQSEPYDYLGHSQPYGRMVLVRTTTAPGRERRFYECLVHELGHSFGAFHCKDTTSVMRGDGTRPGVFQFDEENREVIRLARNRDLRAGGDCVPMAEFGRMVELHRHAASPGAVLPLKVALASGERTEARANARKVSGADRERIDRLEELLSAK